MLLLLTYLLTKSYTFWPATEGCHAAERNSWRRPEFTDINTVTEDKPAVFQCRHIADRSNPSPRDQVAHRRRSLTPDQTCLSARTHNHSLTLNIGTTLTLTLATFIYSFDRAWILQFDSPTPKPITTGWPVAEIWLPAAILDLIEPEIAPFYLPTPKTLSGMHPPEVCNAKSTHQSSEWTILSHVNHFTQGEVIGFQFLLDSLSST